MRVSLAGLFAVYLNSMIASHTVRHLDLRESNSEALAAPALDGVALLDEPAEHTLLAALGPHASLSLPMVDFKTPAGFPSPAADFQVDRLALDSLLETDRPYVFMGRISGQSMSGRNIFDGDIIVINRKIEPVHGHIVVAALNGELTCKTLYRLNGIVKLVAAHPDYPDLYPREDEELVVWGVVTSCIRSFRV